MGLSEADRLAVVAWAINHPEVMEVWLFGSRARGDHRPDSDIDLAVVMTLEEWLHLVSTDLKLSGEVDLDLYEKGAPSEVVGPAVQKDGILVYVRDEKSGPFLTRKSRL